MGRLPSVIWIGEKYARRLLRCPGPPLSQWVEIRCANEVYLTPEEKAFDGTGISPDIEVPVFTTADVATGRDPALARANRTRPV
jgi:C-terminal processing protease CtpA/Prc